MVYRAPAPELFDDEAQELLLAGAKKKLAGLTEFDFFPKVVDADFVDFHAFLLDEALGLSFGRRKLQFDEKRCELLGRTSRNFLHWRFNGSLTIAEDALEIFGGFASRIRALKTGDYFFREAHLCIHGMELATGNFILQSADVRGNAVGDQFEVAPHQLIRDRHHFA